MKRLLFFLLGLCISVSTFSQSNWCGTMDHLAEMNAGNPNWEQELQEHLDDLDKRIPPHYQPSLKGDPQIIIPVVVHVLHDNGQGNISYEQILDGINLLNIDMRRLNEDTADARQVFRDVGADLEIEFRLATLDPDGKCTNGVNRKNVAGQTDGVTYDATDNAKRSSQGGADAWPTDQYFNIWLVNTVRSSGGEGITLGYAEFPFSGMGPTYGIIMRQDNWGSIGTAANSSLGGPRTITHEVGHCLNLFHTFQGGCGSSCSSSGDRVCDTPPTIEATFGCNKSQNTCTNVSAGDFYGSDVDDMIENYMSYDACTNLFSQGQKARVWQAVQEYPNFANLTSAANLAATGAISTDLPICAVEYTTDIETIICPDQSITFNDVSYHNVTGVTWTFEGGTPSTSTEKNPTVFYATPGSFAVTMEVTDGNTTQSKTFEDAVFVADPSFFVAPFSENFGTIDALGSYEYAVGQPVNSRNFKISETVGLGDSKSVYLQNRVLPAGNEMEFILRNIDATNVSDLKLDFDYAYAARSSASTDALKIYVSIDCGQNWSLRGQFKGSKLQTAPMSNVSFVPTEDEWKKSTEISLTNYIGGSIQIRFLFETGAGNNFYLDNINFYDPTAIDEIQVRNLEIYPNPTKEFVHISAPIAGNYTVEIMTLDGKVAHRKEGVADVNEQIRLDVNQLTPGLYFLTYMAGNTRGFEKIIIE